MSMKFKNPFSWLWRYVNESLEELRKVTWPSKQETTKYSMLVVGLCLALATFFGGLDWVLNKGLQWLIYITS